MICRVFLIGIILFLSFTCLSNGADRDGFHSSFTLDELLSNHQDSETSEAPSIDALSFLIYDESKDPFNLETLPVYQQKPDFDIPIVINDKVEQSIRYFRTTIRDRFVTWLARSKKYIPLIKNLLREQGLPEDLVYMALIESGLNPYAYSRARAVGMWQFITLTGRKYGLRVNWWVDERRDPEKSTIAAAKYLKDLYEMFECWYLAAAGYNAGEYKIINAIKRYRTEDFWTLTKHRYLKRETKNYVPLMIAAALVAKDPEKYGFTNIAYEEPLRFEKVKVPELTALSVVAKACETSLEEIKDLNPELQRGVTPPNEVEYEVNIPFGKKDLFQKNFETLQPLEKFQFKTHLVKNGETLRGIAKSCRVDLEALLEINQLNKTSRIFKGMTLFIPISKDEEIKPLKMAQNKNGKVRNSKPKR